MIVLVKRLPHCVALPQYQTEASAGMDLVAALIEPLVLHPGYRLAVPTGIQLEIPTYLHAEIRSRSGLALHNGVVVLNSPGTIDSDFRGEIMVLLINHGNADFTITPGLRIAQLVFSSTITATLVEVSELDDTDRGSGGFGSTGT